MNIRTITTANQIHLENETVLVLGYFDGLHLGHQELFKKARQIADEKGLKVALLTFPESPKLAFVRYQPELLLHLQSPEDRFQKLNELGVDELFLIDFTTDFASKTAKEFVDQFVKALRARVLIAGFDYSFGSDKKNASDLAVYFDGQVEVISPVLDQGEKISSTRIRPGRTRQRSCTSTWSPFIQSGNRRAWGCAWPHHWLSYRQSSTD